MTPPPRPPPPLDDDDDDDDDSSGTRLYALLGLPRTATQPEIKAAFRSAARRLHPDRLLQENGNEKEKGEKTAARAAEAAAAAKEGGNASSSSGAAFAAAREAFLVLSDPVRRAAYDAQGTGGRRWYSRHGGGSGGNGNGNGREAAATTEAFWPAKGAKTATSSSSASSSPSPSPSRFPQSSAQVSDALVAGLSHLRGVDPRTQLVLTCGLCSRPAGVSCAVCQLPLCALCCRRRHARAPGDSFESGYSGKSNDNSRSSLAFRPHWPLVDAPGSMARRLAARELEAKRLADAAAADAACVPHSRGSQELEDVRGMRERYLAGGGRKEKKERGGGAGGDEEQKSRETSAPAFSSSRTSYDPFFARFYAWDQTPEHVVVAVRLPTGDADRGLRVEMAEATTTTTTTTMTTVGESDEKAFTSFSSSSSSRPTHRLLVAADGAPPVIDRLLARGVERGEKNSSSPPLLVRRSADRRSLLLTLTKSFPGEQWPCLFVGDSIRARCVEPPYAVREGSGSGKISSRRGGNDDDGEEDRNEAPSADDDGAQVEVELCPGLLPLPGWVEKRHVSVETTREKLVVRVAGVFELERFFWDSTGRAVLPGETTWTLEKKRKERKRECGRPEEEGAEGKNPEAETATSTSTSSSTSTSIILTITLCRPSSLPANDNRRAPRPDGRPPGRRFFACDDDFYSLEGSIAAGVLALASSSSSPSDSSPSLHLPLVGAAVRAPPWRHAAAAADGGMPRRVRDAACLPLAARRQLEAMLEEEEEEEEEDGEGESSSDESDDDESSDSDDGF